MIKPAILSAITIAATWLLAACTSPTDANIMATVDNSVIVVRNPTSERLNYFAIERNATEYTDWIMCATDDIRCPHIEPGSLVSIPLNGVFGWWPEAREVNVYLWRVVQTPIGPTATEVKTLIVQVR